MKDSVADPVRNALEDFFKWPGLLHQLFCLLTAWQYGIAGARLVVAAIVERSLAVCFLTVGCQRTEGAESMMEELKRPFLSTGTLLSSNFTAVQLTGWSVLLMCSLKGTILYFSWSGAPFAL